MLSPTDINFFSTNFFNSHIWYTARNMPSLPLRYGFEVYFIFLKSQYFIHFLYPKGIYLIAEVYKIFIKILQFWNNAHKIINRHTHIYTLGFKLKCYWKSSGKFVIYEYIHQNMQQKFYTHKGLLIQVILEGNVVICYIWKTILIL